MIHLIDEWTIRIGEYDFMLETTVLSKRWWRVPNKLPLMIDEW
jgi:hypothetical protein